MDSVEKEFYREVAERKSVARAAYGRVNGSKTKRRARMPSDYLTEKQRKELSGEVMTYNFQEKISWKTFKGWPKDIQQEYMDWFCDKWKLGETYMAKMFNVTKTTLNLYKKQQGLIFAKAGGTLADKMRFEEWLLGTEEPAEIKDEPKVESDKIMNPATMKGGRLEFDGSFAVILESIYRIIGDGTGKIRVEWSVEE